MSDKYNNLNNDNGNESEYNYWKDQGSKKDHYSSKDFKSEDTGEYRYTKDDVDSKYHFSSDDYSTDINHEGYNMNQANGSSYQSTSNQNNLNKNKKPAGKVKKGFNFVLKAILFGIIVAFTFIATNEIIYQVNPNLNKGGSIFTKDSASEEFVIEQTSTLDNTIEDTDVTIVAREAMPSVVTITGTFTETYNFFGQQIDEQKQNGGSGFIIDRNESELLIATNNHVVEGAKPIMVTFIDGESAEAIIKGTDSIADLAVIAVDIDELSEKTKNAIQIADILEDDEEVKVGEKVVAIGNALGVGQSVTVGYVSALDREINIDGNKMTLLQTDAAINPGNSGGALLNMKGEVIGINTVKFADSKVEGMGYAIPIDRAMPILNELKSREIIVEEEQGFLGVVINDVTQDIADILNWPVGVYVRELVDNGPADKAGVQFGDIIIGLNEIEITSSTQLIEKVTSYRAGTEVSLRLMRSQGGEYEEIEIQVVLGRNPNR